MLKYILKETHAQLLYAKTGIEAIKLCKKNKKIDIVLMEFRLPDIDGCKVIHQIKQFRKELPVVAQTVYVMEKDKKRCDPWRRINIPP